MAALAEWLAEYLGRVALPLGAYPHVNRYNVMSLVPLVRWIGYEPQVVSVTQGNFPTMAFADAGVPLSENSAVPSFPVSHPFARIASLFLVYRFVNDIYWWPNDQVKFQIEAKKEATIRTCADAFINGGQYWWMYEFDGIKKRIPAGQTVYAGNDAPDGDYMSLDDLGRALNLVSIADGCKPDLLLMNRDTIREYARACNDVGMAPELITREECHERIGRFCAAGSAGICDMVCPPVSCAFQRVRICLVDDIRCDEQHGLGPNLTSAYFISLGVGRGVALTIPGNSDNCVFRLDRMPYYGLDADEYRLGMNVGLMNFAKTAWARLGGIKTMRMHA